MPILKKLVFAPFFLLCLFALFQNLDPLLKNVYLLFDFKPAVLIQILNFLLALLGTGFFFVIFCTLSQDKKLVLPVAFLGALLALPLLPTPLNLIIAVGFLIVLTISFFALTKKLNTYITFKPTTILVPSITQVGVLLLLITSLAFYIAADSKVKMEGFQIPDPIIDTALKMAMPEQSTTGSQATTQSSLPQISPEQLQLLKQNPELLRQYGLDPAILDQVNTNPPTGGSQQLQSIEQNIIKAEVKKQIQGIVAPQIGFLAPVLAVGFFFSLQFGLSLLSLFLKPLILLLFWVLEKTGFTKYTTEMREVKKLVV